MRAAVIGGGLAGCEAAWFLAERGVAVTLYEQKPQRLSAAHRETLLGELVCSNSLKADRIGTAAGMLKKEMELLGSLLVPCARETSVPAGGALAVDRMAFASLVTEKIAGHPNITVLRQPIDRLPPPEEGPSIVATGPLTGDALAEDIQRLCGGMLSFYDAAAPIVKRESIDDSKVFFAARYDRGDSDYINCPMNRQKYEQFHQALLRGKRAKLHQVDTADKPVYEGCMPIEVLAARGEDAMRFGPLKPVGLKDPRTGKRPWAVVQLRAENREKTMYNLVGLQTNLTFGEQKRIFSLIPGLEQGDFVRYGVMHRNTFLCSPRLLEAGFRLKGNAHIRFAGQITGVEGYMESAANGLAAAFFLWQELRGGPEPAFPSTTMTSALCRHVLQGQPETFQPMGANMGLLPPLPEVVRDKQRRYEALARRGLEDLQRYLDAVKGFLPKR